jgi:thiol-disulfide isomerase/thioredoxin
MFDFLSDRENQARKDTANKLLTVKATPDYYTFLRRADLNDRKLLIAPDFWVLANRFEFTRDLISLPDRYFRKPIQGYLFEDLKLTPDSADKELLEHVKNFPRNFRNATPEERSLLMSKGSNLAAAFGKKYQKYAKAYEKKYPAIKNPGITERTLEDWSVKDSLLGSYFGLEHNLIYDILKARSLKFAFSSHLKGQREAARDYLSSLERGIKDEWVSSQAEGFFYRSYPLIPKPVYDLPAGKGTEIFRKVIDQYKGKILFVDFWGIFCGPCVASIKHNKLVRESYKNSKEIEFIFLTSFEESPEDRYKEFIKDQELIHTYRLPSDDFRYLRELFKFNGIPRYIVISKEGQVLNDNFEMHNFENELKKLLVQK